MVGQPDIEDVPVLFGALASGCGLAPRFEVPLNRLRSYARKVEAISKWVLNELAPAKKG